MNPLLEAALDYAGRGWPVLGLKELEKIPDHRLVRHGLHDATTNPALIEKMWSVSPNANIGLRTGVSFDVLDIDGPLAMSALEEFGTSTGGGDDVDGPTVKTPRGWHVYGLPTGKGNRVNVGGLAGIDWRGDGGYVVAPPSIKADGSRWQWLYTDGTPGLGPDDGLNTPIVSFPAWVLELLDYKPGRSAVPASPGARAGMPTAYGQGALERSLGRVAMAAPGTRNHALNAAAFGLGQLLVGHGLDVEDVAAQLVAVGLRIGLDRHEVEQTVSSGLAAGYASPKAAR